jgi:hypothetical protein
VTQTMDRALDPELVCTRVMARLIEDIGCVAITPDSPVWSDLGTAGPDRAGELRVYMGKGRVQKIVSSCLQAPSAAIDSHSLVVLTRPESAVPHLLVDIVRDDARIHVHLDLLPKRELAISPAYIERCYEPLSGAHRQIEDESRFVTTRIALRQRALLSPWGSLFSVSASDLGSAEPFVDGYVTHWASLLRSDAIELAESPENAARDLTHRRLLFSRAVDPLWRTLDKAIGKGSVDQILAALTES